MDSLCGNNVVNCSISVTRLSKSVSSPIRSRKFPSGVSGFTTSFLFMPADEGIASSMASRKYRAADGKASTSRSVFRLVGSTQYSIKHSSVLANL